MKQETTTGTPVKYPGLQRQPGAAQNGNWVVGFIRRFLRAQFGRPSGFIGSIVGRIMARTASNHERMYWTLSLLDILPADRVLEIGFGPGFAIQRASVLASRGFVAGVDHSDVMVRQAAKLNAGAVRAGQVSLQLGSASELPKFNDPFDKIFTINSIHFWHEPVECLGALRSMLKPGGTIAVTLQPRSKSATDADALEIGREVGRNLELAGFSQVRVEVKTMKPIAAACALGRNVAL